MASPAEDFFGGLEDDFDGTRPGTPGHGTGGVEHHGAVGVVAAGVHGTGVAVDGVDQGVHVGLKGDARMFGLARQGGHKTVSAHMIAHAVAEVAQIRGEQD